VSTGTITPYRSGQQAGRDGFPQLLRAEWTKFRTVRGWVAGMVVAAFAMLFVGLFAAGSAHIACHAGPGTPTRTGRACVPPVPAGPGGEAVTDNFYLVRRPLTGNGSITVRLTSLTGLYSPNGAEQAGEGLPAAGSAPASGPPPPGLSRGLQPWSKAGIIIKQGTGQGSAYAAMLLTGSHGVRMQYDFTHDTAGSPGGVSAASPRWLRLTRAGDTVTGYESADGSHWTQVGTATLRGLPATVQAGLFAASPQYTVTTESFGGETGNGGPSQDTAVFDHLALSGTSAGKAWTGDAVGSGDRGSGGFRQAGGVFTVAGSGDIAPLPPGGGAGGPSATIEQHLVGAFAGLIAVAVVAAMFITAEYRRGLIRTTLAASPRRGRVLAAKAIVAGSVSFAAGLVAAIIAVAGGNQLSRAEGFYLFPVSMLTEVRVVAGTAALLAVTAVLALAIGSMLRRSAAAVTAVIVAIVLPYILGVASVLPAGAADWLLRVTPAAGFAIQQSIPQYSQVTALYTPGNGYFPLAPWGGFAVLCGYTAAAMALAVYLLRRRDA
jgi:ABC-type transport system involved in multi-copper enzyme maturation permease subunit